MCWRKIGSTPVMVGGGGEMSKPKKRVQIEKIEIVPAESVK